MPASRGGPAAAPFRGKWAHLNNPSRDLSRALANRDFHGCASGAGALHLRGVERLLFALVAACLAVPSIAAVPPEAAPPPKSPRVVHVVTPGQTLFRIAQAYGVPLARLIEANRLKSPNAIAAGRRLVIPGAKAPVAVAARRPLTEAERGALERSLTEDRAPVDLPRGWAPPQPKGPGEFIWPLEGPMNSAFGPRGGRRHAGIDVGSPRAQQVVAAADGEVAFAQATRTGFGNVVVLEHEGGFSTVYAHLSLIVAREGESARQGQPIGGVGTTGNASGPHLHFEIRHRGVPLDPLRYLPQTLDDLVKDLVGPRR